jgi:hypothetical protein
MLNRRKAMIGWLVYSAAKPFIAKAVKDKAKGAQKKAADVTGASGPSKKKRAGKMLALAAAAAGAVAFWRSRKEESGGGWQSSEPASKPTEPAPSASGGEKTES